MIVTLGDYFTDSVWRI